MSMAEKLKQACKKACSNPLTLRWSTRSHKRRHQKKVMMGIPLTCPGYHAVFRGRVVGAIEAAIAEFPDAEAEIVVSPATHMQGLAGRVEASNFLARKCAVEGYDFLWIVEADVEVPQDALVRLLSGGGDIDLGIYPNHRSDLRLMAGYFQEHPDRVKPLVHSVFGVDQLRGKVFESMVWAGIGCALIHRRVLEKLRFVWDKHEYRRFVGVHDQLFLFRAQQLGFRVFLHGDVLCGHLPEWSLQKLEDINCEC